QKNLRLFFYRPVYGMVYSLVVSPTSTGKGVYPDIVEAIVTPAYYQATNVQSAEGLLEVLCEVSPPPTNKGRPTYKPVPALLLLNEFTYLLKAAQIENSRLMEALNGIYQSEKPFTIARS